MPDVERISVDSVPEFGVGLSLSSSPLSPDGALAAFRAQAVVACHTAQEMERFIASRDSLPAHLQGFLVPYTREEYVARGAKLFLTIDGRGGVALLNGELGSLFSLPGAHYGDQLVEFAVTQGACTLSCYDTRGKLPALYGRHGFKETLRASWNDEYAPKTWNYEVWGRPDYVEMSR